MSIKIITPTDDSPLEEAILSHDAEAKLPNRCELQKENIDIFLDDLEKGKLDCYKGTYVAYQKGNVVGQSKGLDELWQTASKYYGSSSLIVISVPKKYDDEVVLKFR